MSVRHGIINFISQSGECVFANLENVDVINVDVRKGAAHSYVWVGRACFNVSEKVATRVLDEIYDSYDEYHQIVI